MSNGLKNLKANMMSFQMTKENKGRKIGEKNAATIASHINMRQCWNVVDGGDRNRSRDNIRKPIISITDTVFKTVG